jgi:uncharacterized protein YndB with AHSA1/START domain
MIETHADASIVQEIMIKAPAELIFTALIDPGQRLQWWGAEGRFQATQMESDLRPGGEWMMRGTGLGGQPFHVRGEYRTIERPRLLEFTWLPDWDANAKQSIVRFDLEERDGITMVRITHTGLTREGARAHRGWPDILAWLRAYAESRS